MSFSKRQNQYNGAVSRASRAAALCRTILLR